MIRIPNVQLDKYVNYPKVEIITINSEKISETLPDTFNFSTIKNLETIFIEGEEEENMNPVVELIKNVKM